MQILRSRLIARWRIHGGDADVNSWKWLKKWLGRRDGSVGGNLRYLNSNDTLLLFSFQLSFVIVSHIGLAKYQVIKMARLYHWHDQDQQLQPIFHPITQSHQPAPESYQTLSEPDWDPQLRTSQILQDPVETIFWISDLAKWELELSPYWPPFNAPISLRMFGGSTLKCTVEPIKLPNPVFLL